LVNVIWKYNFCKQNCGYANKSSYTKIFTAYLHVGANNDQ